MMADLRHATTTIGVVLPLRITDHSGRAHIYEHLLMCGNQDYPYSDLLSTLKANHVLSDINASTHADRIVLHASTWIDAEAQSIRHALETMIRNQVFNADDIRREGVDNAGHNDDEHGKSGIVLNEMRAVFTNSHEARWQAIYAALYPNSALGFNANGDPSCIEQLTPRDIKNCPWLDAQYQDAITTFTVQTPPQGVSSWAPIAPAPTFTLEGSSSRLVQIPGDKPLYAWTLAAAEDIDALFSAHVITYLLEHALAMNYSVDTRNGDHVMMLDCAPDTLVQRLGAVAPSLIDAALLHANAKMLLPGDWRRPAGVQWVNRLSAFYARGLTIPTYDTWHESCTRLSNSWRDQAQRAELIESACMRADLTTLPAAIFPSDNCQNQGASASPNADTQRTVRPSTYRQASHNISPYVLSDTLRFDSGNDAPPPYHRATTVALRAPKGVQPKAVALSPRICATYYAYPTEAIEEHAALHLLAAHWTLEWLYPTIRMENRAYAAFARYAPQLHGLQLISYADPKPAQSLALMHALPALEMPSSTAIERARNYALSTLAPRYSHNAVYVQGVALDADSYAAYAKTWQAIAHLSADAYLRKATQICQAIDQCAQSAVE